MSYGCYKRWFALTTFLIRWDLFISQNQKICNGWSGTRVQQQGSGEILPQSEILWDIERFAISFCLSCLLNPERVSMPDIDVDFAYAVRSKLTTRQKSMADQVVQIVTFGTLAAKLYPGDVDVH